MKWHLSSFDTLDAPTLYQLLQLRSAIFVVEQQCIYQDIDDKDPQALHLWCCDDKQRIVACCRLLPPGLSYAEASIGRVATATDARGLGLGRILMHKALQASEAHWQSVPVRISAQLYLQRFYESLGFDGIGEPYLEDGIPHLEMLYRKSL